MGFEICNFSDLKEGNAIFEKMRKSIDLKRLVPVLGSGFSFNFHTNGGRVPSVDDLKSEMVRNVKNMNVQARKNSVRQNYLNWQTPFCRYSRNVQIVWKLIKKKQPFYPTF